MSPKTKDDHEFYLPVLVELVFRFSGLFLVMITLTVAIVSFVSGASYLQIVFRTGIAILVVGILLVILTSKVSTGVLEVVRTQLAEARKTGADPRDKLKNTGTD